MKVLRNILFFVLSTFFGFFCGIQIAILVDAGKDQMLAGGAIVLGYGVMGAVIALVIAIVLFIMYKSKSNWIKLLNIILTILLLCFWLFFYIRFKNREAQKNEKIESVLIKKKMTDAKEDQLKC